VGGEGTRLKPITEKIPKPMVEINNRPFLEYLFDLLLENGIDEAVLCAGYLWEKVKEHFGDEYTGQDEKSLTLKYSIEPRFYGTGGAVKNAEKYVNDYFFIVYGDTYLPIDYRDMARIIHEKGTMGLISVYNNSDNITNNNVTVNNDDYVIKYDKFQETPDMNGVEAGTLLFNKSILSLLPDVDDLDKDQKVSLEMYIYPKLIAQRQLIGYITDIRYYDMGTPERMKIISEVLK
jgi:NDP-sugar pyrophosphorylase family protein